MINFIYTIADAIFECTSILVPCLLILYLFKIKFSVINKPTLILAINSTLLFGSLLFISGFIIQIVSDLFSEAEYVQYKISNQLFGNYWWAFWIEIFPGYLLPQILWVSKFRKTIISSVIIFFFWIAIFLLIKVASSPSGWHFEIKYTAAELLEKAVIYIVIMSGMYLVLSKRMALSGQETNL
jgi:hypothetical protein